jgi:hypothetical protein
VVAATDNVVALFTFMKILDGAHIGIDMAKLVLPPPRGEAPHAKSAAAVAEAYGIFEMLTERKQQTQTQQAAATKTREEADDAVATPPAALTSDAGAAVALGVMLLGVLLLCAAVWRLAAAAERRRPHRA